MAEIVVIISVSLIFLLILIQNISIRFLYDGKIKIELDYSFITVILKPKKDEKSRNKLNFSAITEIKQAVSFLLSKAELKIDALKLSTNETDPYKFGIRYKNLFSFFH